MDRFIVQDCQLHITADYGLKSNMDRFIVVLNSFVNFIFKFKIQYG